jgi:endoglucanase
VIPQLVSNSLNRELKLKKFQGTCTLTSVQSPMGSSYNITGQISHFNDIGFNTFRLPVSWQYLTNNVYTTTGILDATSFAAYDS